MKILKILGWVVVGYVLVVVAFESLIGYLQPEDEQQTLTITTTDSNGDVSDRVLTALDVDGKLYVAVNHWPRAWYKNALANPRVKVARGGVSADYLAVPVEGSEHDAVNAAKPLDLVILLLTGFPPRYFVRLDLVDG